MDGVVVVETAPERGAVPESDVALYERKAKGLVGKLLRKFFGGRQGIKSRVLANTGNQSREPPKKKARRTSSKPVLDGKPISLCQNRYKCVPVLMVLIEVQEEVILTFMNQSQLDAFLSTKSINSGTGSLLQTTIETQEGPRFALVAKAIENNANVNEPFQLLQSGEDVQDLYPSGGGLVLQIQMQTNIENPRQTQNVVLTYEDVSSNQMDLWISRQTAEFEGLQEFFNGMDTKERLDAIDEMQKLLDPHQQILWGLKFYKDYCEARRREHAEYTRSTDRAFKRQTKEMDKVRRARIADINLSLEDIHKLQSEELTTKKLEEYSSFVNSIVENDSRQCERDFQTFRKSAVTDENMDLIIERTKRDFPISFQFHNGMILPDRVRSTMDTRKKELSALWGFISSIRKRDPRLCISLAGLVSLSLASGKISDSMIKFVNHLGIAASKGVLTNRMKEIAARSANTWEWQANELFIMLFFDNMQYALPYKVQANGKSTNMIEGTSRFARKVIPFEPPDRVPFVTNEGQPKLTYVDQAIPAPINALPFEKLTDEQFVKLLEYEGGIQSALEPSVFQVEILGEESSSHVFDMNKMDPTDGSRCERYIKLLRKCRSYGGFWQYLSCRHTVASARVHAGPLQKHVSDYLDTVAAARKTVLSNARLFHMETVRQWFPQFEEETLTFLFAASIFREKTTQECAKVIVQLLLDCGLLVLCADKKIRVRPDWELYRVFINGDQYTVDKANQFTAKAAASLGAYSDDYESNMNIAKAMTRLLWSHGQLHISFRFCFGCYVIAYPGFLHPFQAAAQVTRLVMDSTKCFQLATTFLRIVYDQLYRGFLFHWLFNVAADGKYETIHDLVNGFDEFRESMYESCDEVYRFIASFFELCEDFFMYLDCVACADQLGCEMLLKHYQPIFYLCGMTNYKEVVWHQMDTMYGSETSIRDRETYRRSLMIRLNKGKSCIGTDTFGELVNLKTVSMNKSKDIKHCAAKSAAVTAVTQADEWRKRNMCFEEPKPPKSSTKKRTSFVRDRISELACVAGLYQETPGRMVSDLSLYSLLDDLETPFPPTEADDDGDDDELTAAERADKERNASIDAAVSGVIRKEDGNKSLSDESDDSESDDDNDEEESASDGGNGKKKRKLLTKNNKVRIGSSTQDLLTIDPKGVAKVNPYTKGKEMIAKDDVKEKRARKKVVQERKVKLVELCFRRICREKEVMSSSYCIHPLPSTDREESQRTYDSLYSPWK